MRHTGLRSRFWIETILAALFTLTAALTLVQPAWIELFFGVDADRGSGSLESGLTLGLGAAALLLALLARLEWMRAKVA